MPAEWITNTSVGSLSSFGHSIRTTPPGTARLSHDLDAPDEPEGRQNGIARAYSVPALHVIVFQALAGRHKANSRAEVADDLVRVAATVAADPVHSMAWQATVPDPGPDTGGRLHSDNIWQTQFGDTRTELTVDSITGIRQDRRLGHFLLNRLANLLKRNLRFGSKTDRLGDTRLPPAFGIGGPDFRQVQTKRDGHTGGIGADRQDSPPRGSCLVCLTARNTVVPRQRNESPSWEIRYHPQSMPELVPCLHRRQHVATHLLQHGFIAPRRIGDQVV